MQRITTLSLSLLVLSIFSGCVIAQDEPRPCYFPSGKLAPNYIACNDAATGHSACCQNSNQTTCFSTGLCYLDSGFYERGACTDQSWASDSCPGPCRGFEDSGQNILACSDSSNSFCCATGGDPSCCRDTSKYFTFSIGQIAFMNGAPAPRTRLPASSTTSGSVPSPTSDPTGTPQPIEGDDGKKALTGVIAGMGVGIAIPSVIAIVFAWLYFRERKKSKKQRATTMGMYHPDGDNSHSQFAGAGAAAGENGSGAEREGFMSRMWGGGGNGHHDAHGLTPIPPKYVPPERRAEQEHHQMQQPPVVQQYHEAHSVQVGELPSNTRTDGLSELATDPRY